MKKIKLTMGKVAIIDDDDYEKLSKYLWCASRARQNGRWLAAISRNKSKRVTMHRLIMGPSKKDIDHINGNVFDNRKSNLRFATRSQNLANQPPRKSNRTGFKGVRKVNSRYRAQLRNKHVGYFATADSAAKAYDKAARSYWGEFAFTNFGE